MLLDDFKKLLSVLAEKKQDEESLLLEIDLFLQRMHLAFEEGSRSFEKILEEMIGLLDDEIRTIAKSLNIKEDQLHTLSFHERQLHFIEELRRKLAHATFKIDKTLHIEEKRFRKNASKNKSPRREDWLRS